MGLITDSFADSTKKYDGKKLRWAFIGMGGISESHFTALKNELPEVEVVAGCDINEETLAKKKEAHNLPAAYLKWDDMLREIKPDIVDVCTPNGVHCPAAIAALEAGAHVITEKPMAMNPAECQRMIDCAKANNRKLVAGFQFRYHPACQMFRNACKSGRIGDILYAKVTALRRRGIPNWGVFGQKDLQGGGPMIDIGVHAIEATHYCMGSPKPVAASGNTWTYIGNKPSDVASIWPNWDYKTYTVEDLAVGQIRFENGALMQIESSFAAHIEKDVFNFVIVGTKGGFNFETSTIFTDQDGFMVDIKPNYLGKTDFPDMMAAKLRNLTDSILKGTPLEAPGEEGIAVQKIIDGIYRSAEAHHEITID